MALADAFWSSRARVVYIFEEELNGFLTDYFTCYFVVKIIDFRGPWFCLGKLRFAEHGACSREPQESPKRALSELEGSLWEPLGLSWGLPGDTWGAPGVAWALLGLSWAPRVLKTAQREPDITQRHWISKNIAKPMVFMVFGTYLVFGTYCSCKTA